MSTLQKSFKTPFEEFPHFSKLNEIFKEARRNVFKTMVKGNGPLKPKSDDGFPFAKYVEPWDAPTCLPKFNNVQSYNLA
jgi:hypothetical protein